MRIAAIHKLRGWERTALFNRKGTQEQAIHYATKPHKDCTSCYEKEELVNQQCKNCIEEEQTKTYQDGPIIFGKPPIQGNSEPKQKKITAFLRIAEEIKKGATMKQIAEDFPEEYMKNHKGIKQWKDEISLTRQKKTKVIIYWGVSGAGKSYKVFQQDPLAYEVPDNEGNFPWFDGYDGQKSMVLNDFSGWIKHSMMLKMMDRYPMQIRNKGGHTTMIPDTLFITSNHDPKTWYRKLWDKNEETERAFFRRVDIIEHFTEKWEENEDEPLQWITRGKVSSWEKPQRNNDEHSVTSNYRFKNSKLAESESDNDNDEEFKCYEGNQEALQEMETNNKHSIFDEEQTTIISSHNSNKKQKTQH